MSSVTGRTVNLTAYHLMAKLSSFEGEDILVFSNESSHFFVGVRRFDEPENAALVLDTVPYPAEGPGVRNAYGEVLRLAARYAVTR